MGNSNLSLNVLCDIYLLAQTTDSGSNNITMAKAMHNTLFKTAGPNYQWDPETMHIQCFCHKIALIVNAGLKELGLEEPPPRKVKDSILGKFPIPNSMEPIAEEDEDELSEDTSGVCDEESSFDPDEDNDSSSNDEEEDQSESDDDDSNHQSNQERNSSKSSSRPKSNHLHDLTKSVSLHSIGSPF